MDIRELILLIGYGIVFVFITFLFGIIIDSTFDLSINGANIPNIVFGYLFTYCFVLSIATVLYILIIKFIFKKDNK